jgi:ankyrin repeat protein
MMKYRAVSLFLIICVAFFACSSPQKKAEGELKHMGIKFSEQEFYKQVVQGNTEVVKLFLQAGMSPQVKIGDTTVLMEAARRAHNDIAIELINAGADVNAKDSYGATPLIFAGISGATEVMEALIKKGADVKAKNYMGRTALIEVLTSENEHKPDIVQTLIDAGADVNARANFGSTAFMMAAASQFAKAMIDAGADVNAKNDEGKTALMMVVAYGYAQAVKTLINAGADVNAKDNYGVTVLMRAKDNPEIAKILRSAGAKE